MKTAPFLVRWFLLACGCQGITMPWKAVYCLAGFENDQGLLRHENVHVAQIERDGAVIWTFKIFWYLLRYGYKNSPYEVEARKGALV